jgi:hypothetical protein
MTAWQEEARRFFQRHPVLTMGPSRRLEQARRQHRKQLQHKDLFGTRTPYMLIQGTAPDIIEDPANQLVGTGLTYVDIPDEQTTSVQPPTTSLPWCAGSRNGIRQSKCCDTFAVCFSSIFCNHARTVTFSASLLYLVHTYFFVSQRLLFRSPGTNRRP